jgi:hypothetical protein
VIVQDVSKPNNAKASIDCDSGKFQSAIELLLQLSLQGKLALKRVITAIPPINWIG